MELLQKAASLYSNSLISSAKIILGNLISSLQNEESILHVKAHILYADCFADAEPKRAIFQYRTALSKIKSFKLNDPVLIDTILYKMAQLYSKLCDFKNSQKTINEITNLNSIPVLLLAAQLHLQLNQQKEAIEKYACIAKLDPFAIEAHLALIRLGAPLNAVLELCPANSLLDVAKAGSTEASGMVCSADADDWFKSTVSAHHFNAIGDYASANRLFSLLDGKFVNNIFVKLQIADTFVKLGNSIHGIQCYEEVLGGLTLQIRRIDPHLIDDMDKYAGLIRIQGQGKTMEINQLAEYCLEIAVDRAEVFVILARYFELRSMIEKALSFAEKVRSTLVQAIQLKRNHFEAYKLKGSLLLQLGKAAEASKVFRYASNHIGKDIFIYQGLVECFILQKRLREAEATAKECIKLMPRNSKALSLVGKVSFKLQDNVTARKAFEKALSVDPNCLDTTMAFSQFLIDTEEYEDAVQILQALPEPYKSDIVYLRMGEVHMTTKDYANAMKSFQAALRLNKFCSAAIQGREKIEKILSGNLEEDEESEEIVDNEEREFIVDGVF